MANLFKTAKEKAPKASKKSDKLIVDVKGAEFDQNLIKMAQLEAQIDQLTAELEMAKGIVKEIGVQTFENVYTKNGGYPGSFILASESDASIMIVPMDKYLKCDEARFNDLKESYGADVVTEKTEFVLNPVLLEKYGEVLSDLIQNSTDIADDDKDELFQAKVSYSVSKGAIEKAFTWGKGQVSQFMLDIQPIFAMKGAKTK